MTFLATQVKVADVTSSIDAVLGLVPKVMGIVGFFLLLILLWRAGRAALAKGAGLSIIELAAVVIAFAIVAGKGA